MAGLIYYMKLDHGPLAAKLPLTKDVLGVVATLGKVHDDNLSRSSDLVNPQVNFVD